MPDENLGWVEEARKLLIRDRSAEALTVLDRNLDGGTPSAIGLAFRAWALTSLNRLPEGLQSAERAAEVDPSCSQAWCELADLQSLQGQHEAAVASMNRHFLLAQDHTQCSDADWGCYSKRAQYEHRVGNYELAIAFGKKALDLGAGAVGFSNYTVGECLRVTKRSAEALPYLEAQMQFTPNDDNVQQSFVYALYETDQHYSVIAECEEALTRKRRCGWALAYKGSAYLRLHEYGPAIAALTHAQEVDKSLTWVSTLLNKARSEQNKEEWKDIGWEIAKSLLIEGGKQVAVEGTKFAINKATEAVKRRRLEALRNERVIEGQRVQRQLPGPEPPLPSEQNS